MTTGNRDKHDGWPAGSSSGGHRTNRGLEEQARAGVQGSGPGIRGVHRRPYPQQGGAVHGQAAQTPPRVAASSPGDPMYQGDIATGASNVSGHHSTHNWQAEPTQHNQAVAKVGPQNPAGGIRGEEELPLIEAEQEVPTDGPWNHPQHSPADEERRVPSNNGASGLNSLLLPHLSRLVSETQKYLNAVSGVLQDLQLSLETELQPRQSFDVAEQPDNSPRYHPTPHDPGFAYSQSQELAGSMGHARPPLPPGFEEWVVNRWREWLWDGQGPGAEDKRWGRLEELQAHFSVGFKQGNVTAVHKKEITDALVVLTYSQGTSNWLFAVPFKKNSSNVSAYFTTSNGNPGGDIQDLIRPCELDPENLSVLRTGEVLV